MLVHLDSFSDPVLGPKSAILGELARIYLFLRVSRLHVWLWEHIKQKAYHGHGHKHSISIYHAICTSQYVYHTTNLLIIQSKYLCEIWLSKRQRSVFTLYLFVFGLNCIFYHVFLAMWWQEPAHQSVASVIHSFSISDESSLLKLF